MATSVTSAENTSIARLRPGRHGAPQQVDGDVVAAIAGDRDAPEDQDAEQQAGEVVAVGDRPGEEIAQDDRDEM